PVFRSGGEGGLARRRAAGRGGGGGGWIASLLLSELHRHTDVVASAEHVVIAGIGDAHPRVRRRPRRDRRIAIEQIVYACTQIDQRRRRPRPDEIEDVVVARSDRRRLRIR